MFLPRRVYPINMTKQYRWLSPNTTLGRWVVNKRANKDMSFDIYPKNKLSQRTNSNKVAEHTLRRHRVPSTVQDDLAYPAIVP